MLPKQMELTRQLSLADVARMHDTAVAILERTGLAVERDDIRAELARRSDFTVDGDRVRMGEPAVGAWLAAHRERHPDPPELPTSPTKPEDITCSASPYSYWVVDADLATVRPMTREDAINGTKLLHVLKSSGVQAGVAGAPCDVPPVLRGIEQYVIGAEYSEAGGHSPLVADIATAEIVREMDKVYGRDYSRTAWCPSPLMFGGHSFDIVWHFRDELASASVGSMPCMGVTAPCDPIATMTQCLAEVVGGAAILHALLPGVPIGIHPHPEPADMRSATMVFGTPEWELLDLMHRDVMAFYHIHLKSKMLHTTASLPGAQAHAERATNALLGVLGGYCNFTSLGMLGVDEVWSPAQVMLDLDLLAHAARIGQGSSSAPGLELDNLADIIDAAIADGVSFLEHESTAANFRAQYQQPRVLQRLGRKEWQAAGSPDVAREAQRQADDLIEQYDYEPPQDILRELRRIYDRGRERLLAM